MPDQEWKTHTIELTTTQELDHDRAQKLFEQFESLLRANGYRAAYTKKTTSGHRRTGAHGFGDIF